MARLIRYLIIIILAVFAFNIYQISKAFAVSRDRCRVYQANGDGSAENPYTMTSGMAGSVYYDKSPGSWAQVNLTWDWKNANYPGMAMQVDNWYFINDATHKYRARMTGSGGTYIYFSTTPIEVDGPTEDTDLDGVINSADAAQCDDQVSSEPDSDLDGIPDSSDPFPNDDRPFTWVLNFHCEDDQGVQVFWHFSVDNGDGQQHMTYGDYSLCDEAGYVTIYNADQTPLTQDDWMDISGEGQFNIQGQDFTPYFGDDSPGYNDAFAGTPSSPAEGIDQGEGVVGGETDSQLLEKVVKNTQAQAKNDQKIADQLKAQNERATEGRELDSERNLLLDKINENLKDLDQDNPEDAEDLSNDVAQGTSDIQTAYNDALAQIDGTVTLPEGFEGYSDIDQEFQSRVDESGLVEMLAGISVEAEGNCSMSADVWGYTIEFSLCPFEDELIQFGVVLQAITALTCLMIVFRRS